MLLVELKVEKFENDKVILLTEDNDKIVWPRRQLPPEVKEGSLIAFAINDQATKPDNKELAKDILNELLDVTDNA
jgi:hypothetical protein